MRVLVFIFFLTPCVSYAQYMPLLEENKIWQINMNYWAFEGFDYAQWKFIVQISRDTTIKDVKYKHLVCNIFYHDSLYIPNRGTDSSFQDARTYALLREDTVNKQVFIYQDFKDEIIGEYLLYDFNLQLGDTLRAYEMGCEPRRRYYGAVEIPPAVVAKIDTIVTNDGKKRKQITFNEGDFSQEFKIIEGIGGVGGPEQIGSLVNPFYWQFEGDDYQESFICLQQNNELIYGKCQSVTGINETDRVNGKLSFSNPTSGYLQFYDSVSIKNIDILNTVGQSVFSSSAISPDGRVDLRAISPGMHSLFVNNTFVGKLMLTAY